MIFEVEMLTNHVVAHDAQRPGGVEWPFDPDRLFSALVAAAGAMPEASRTEARRFLRRLEARIPNIECSDLPPQHLAKHMVYLERQEFSKLATGEQEKDEMLSGRGHALLDGRIVRYIYSDEDECAREIIEEMLSYVTCLGASESLAQIRFLEGGEGERQLSRYVPRRDGSLVVTLPGEGRLEHLDHVFSLRNVQGPAAHNIILRTGRVVRYERTDALVKRGEFAELIPLCFTDKRVVTMEHAVRYVDACRGAFLQAVRGTDIDIPVVTGHLNGVDARNVHVGFVPLCDVGFKNAEGWLRGVGLVLPRVLDEQVRQGIISAWMLPAVRVEDRLLSMGAVNKTYAKDVPLAMRPSTYTGGPKGARTWVSQTPVVFSVRPRGNGARSPLAIVQHMMADVGMPDEKNPITKVTVSKAPFLTGSSFAHELNEWHVSVTFKDLVRGPLGIGRGRFKGRGILIPRPQEES